MRRSITPICRRHSNGHRHKHRETGRPRALIVMPVGRQIGGAERSLRDLLEHTGPNGIAWSVVFLEDGPMVEDLRAASYDVHLLEAGRVRAVHRYAATVLRLARLARTVRAQVVIGWMAKAQLYGGPAAAVAGVPSVWYQVGLASAGSAIDRLATLLPARAILVVSRAGSEAQARLRPAREIQLVYPGIDLRQFHPLLVPAPQTVRRALGLPAAGPIIGTVGRLQRWKGMHLLIEALPEILRSYPSAHVVVVGGRWHLEPDYSDVLSSRVQELGLTRRVTLAGEQTDVERWIQALDVFVLPSSIEPFGLVMLEAMALRKPVVATGAGGPAEVITDGLDGFLVPSSAGVGLAGTILRCLGNSQELERIGDRARRRAEDFSVEAFATRMSEVVWSVADRTAAVPIG